jgi:hypothetical protein
MSETVLLSLCEPTKVPVTRSLRIYRCDAGSTAHTRKDAAKFSIIDPRRSPVIQAVPEIRPMR